MQKAATKKSTSALDIFCDSIYSIFAWLILSIVFSIIIEIVGITCRWWDTNHSLTLLVKERGYIEAIDRFPLLVLAPIEMADSTIQALDSRTTGVYQYLRTKLPEQPLFWYAIAALNILKLLTVRLIVCLFTLPAYILAGLAAGIDGFVQRDIRKYTGGHESSYIFHKAKRLILPSIMSSFALYLMLPWSIPPAIIFAPSVAFFGFMIYITTSCFKKFL